MQIIPLNLDSVLLFLLLAYSNVQDKGVKNCND